MPFRSEKQRRFMYEFHPDIAKRWEAEYGSTPQPSSGQNQKHHAKDDYRHMVPGPKARHTPFRATEKQPDREEPISSVPGARRGKLKLGKA